MASVAEVFALRCRIAAISGLNQKLIICVAKTLSAGHVNLSDNG